MIVRAFEGRDITVSLNNVRMLRTDLFCIAAVPIPTSGMFTIKWHASQRRPRGVPRKEWFALPRGERTTYRVFTDRLRKCAQIAGATSKPFKD